MRKSTYVEPKIPFGVKLKHPATNIIDEHVDSSTENHFNQQWFQANTVASENQRYTSTTYLLLEDSDGRIYDQRSRKFTSKIRVERGNLLRSAVDIPTDEIHREDSVVNESLFMTSLDVSNVYLRVSTNKVTLLIDFEASLLKAIHNIEQRFRFFHDSNLFHFVSHLNVGDRVMVQLGNENNANENGYFKAGWLEWYGEPTTNHGLLFKIRLETSDGNSMDSLHMEQRLLAAPRNDAVLVSGERLRNPRTISILDHDPTFASYGFTSNQLIDTESQFNDIITEPRSLTVMRGEHVSVPVTGGRVRNVPIKLLPSVRQDLTSRMQKNSLSRFPVEETDATCSLHQIPVNENDISASLSNHHISKYFDVPIANKVDIKSHSLPDFNSKSSAREHTVRACPQNCKLAEGDRIVWFDAVNIPRHGTVRWIGYLRAHVNLYVGVEFDEAVGGGTGMFEGQELFICKSNHAGLLPLSVCMKESDMGGERINESVTNFVDQNTSKQFVVGEFSSSCVEVVYKKDRRYGAIKWIGNEKTDNVGVRLAAVEIEGDVPMDWWLSDAVTADFAQKMNIPMAQLTQSVIIVPYDTLHWDRRFSTPTIESTPSLAEIYETNFGSLDSGIEVKQCVPTKNFESLLGRMKGIQGFRNSCYLDATLYAMFVQSTAFDHILRSSSSPNLCSLSQEVKDVLKTEVVYPLRRMHFIRADHVLKLRQLFEKLLPGMSGLTTAEKDPEELLNALFGTILKIKPFLTLRNITDGKIDSSYICSLITEDLWSVEQHRIVSVQSLLERSLFASNIQFAMDPKILIVQIPRYGQQKVFDKIFPSPEVDITHLIYNKKKPCIACGKQATVMCPECFLTKEVLIGQVTYCWSCYQQSHDSYDHRPLQLTHTPELLTLSSQITPRKLQLSAVLCIETSHYVAFVRSLIGDKWVFFDSMADRVGFSDGYNVPQVKLCDQVSQWLCESGWQKMRNAVQREHRLPLEMDADMMRLLSDCYICFYTNEEGAKTQTLSLSRFFPK